MPTGFLTTAVMDCLSGFPARSRLRSSPSSIESIWKAPAAELQHNHDLRPLLALDAIDGKAHRERDGRSPGIESTAALLLPKPPISMSGLLVFAGFAGKIESRRADSNRLPLLQLRVISQALQGFAHPCKSPIPKRLSLLGVAACCTELRSRWYQSGIRMGDS
jgi:hypothetical protein